MSVHGTWVLTASGPHGRVHVVVVVEENGPDGLVGTATVDAERVVLADVELTGDRLTWVQPGTGLLPFELSVGLRIRGDLATGHAHSAGTAPLSLIGMRSSGK